jgi:hypothetical protein
MKKALLIVCVAAILVSADSGARAAFVDGEEHFDGQTLDTAEWQMWADGGASITQNGELFINSLGSEADYTTLYVKAGLGAIVRAEVRIDSAGENGLAGLALTTNSGGAGGTLWRDSGLLSITVNSRMKRIDCAQTRHGSGSGRPVIAYPYDYGSVVGQTYIFNVMRLSPLEAEFWVQYPNGQELGRHILSFENIPDDLYVGLRAWDANATFDNITVITGLETPVAQADGPYTIWVGDPLILNASGSTDLDDDIVSYMWDLDDDGVFETDAGDQPFFVIPYASVEALGLTADGIYDIRLKVTDFTGRTDIDSSSLRVVPEPATLALLTLGGLAILRRRRQR